jgi:Carboxypeptidase regulatory-like domain
LDEPITVTSVHGIVVFKGKDAPLKQVVLEIRGPGSSERIMAAKSRDDGRFTIPRVSEGTYVFKATKDGFQSVVGTLIVSKKADHNKSIKIEMPLGV